MLKEYNPFKSTVKGVKNNAYDPTTVKHIQRKIFETGVCSEREEQYLMLYTDYFEKLPKKIALSGVI